jgi:hypothetical protein
MHATAHARVHLLHACPGKKLVPLPTPRPRSTPVPATPPPTRPVASCAALDDGAMRHGRSVPRAPAQADLHNRAPHSISGGTHGISGGTQWPRSLPAVDGVELRACCWQHTACTASRRPCGPNICIRTLQPVPQHACMPQKVRRSWSQGAAGHLCTSSAQQAAAYLLLLLREEG